MAGGFIAPRPQKKKKANKWKLKLQRRFFSDPGIRSEAGGLFLAFLVGFFWGRMEEGGGTAAGGGGDPTGGLGGSEIIHT